MKRGFRQIMQNLSTAGLVFALLTAILALGVAAVIIYRQRSKLNEERWMRAKVFPLIAEVDHFDENQREYLSPEVVAGLKAGQLTIDEARKLQQQTRQEPA
jgi:hypothetical protein